MQKLFKFVESTATAPGYRKRQISIDNIRASANETFHMALLMLFFAKQMTTTFVLLSWSVSNCNLNKNSLTMLPQRSVICSWSGILLRSATEIRIFQMFALCPRCNGSAIDAGAPNEALCHSVFMGRPRSQTGLTLRKQYRLTAMSAVPALFLMNKRWQMKISFLFGKI